MPKAKISPAEKIAAVERHLAGEAGQRETSRLLGISLASFQQWVSNYESMGAEAFTRTASKKYSPELKTAAVKEYLAGTGSQDYICKKYGVLSKSELHRWIGWYNSHGNFKQPKRGGEIHMAKGRSTTFEERVEMVGHCISLNKDYGKTMKKYGVSYQQIYGWVRKYESDGADGLVDRRGKRRENATLSEVERLRAQIRLKESENLRLQMENDLLKKLEEIEGRGGRS